MQISTNTNTSPNQPMKKIFTLILSLFVFVGISYAQTYTTIADGNLNDPAVWSTDGGATPCGCTPMTFLPTLDLINGGNVEINHSMILTQNTMIFGIALTTNVNAPNGSVTGDFSFDVRSGVLNNYNNVTVGSMAVWNGGFLNQQGQMTVSPGNLTNLFQGRMNLAGNTNVPNGDFINDGMIEIRSNATVIVGGNFTNNEFVNMEPSGCINVTADVTNDGFISLINGPGNAYIESGNNISNNDTWDTDVDYCAGGFSNGLAHPANCSNCGILPVELIGFEGKLDDGQVILSWETTTETGNDFFTIERSNDGQTFEIMTTVSSGSPVSGKVYQAFDVAPYFGISYYRLSQTDLDGTTQKLETVMINNVEEASKHFSAFPNPFNETIRITTFGLEGAPVTIQVLDLSGREVARKEVSETADFSVYEIEPGTLPNGMYVVTVSGKNMTESFKLLHK